MSPMTCPSVTFVEHPAGRHRTHMRNTMSGWIEERNPEGFLRIELEDGFHLVIQGDESMAGERDLLISLARREREIYLQRTEDQ